MSQNSSDNDIDSEVFGPLVSIPPDSLFRLAKSIRHRVFGVATSTGNIIARIGGSYNLVHIIQLDSFKLVIRIPASGWGDGLTETAARALESQVTTLRLIASQTSIPVPEIYAFDTTTNNEIEAPYICMNFISGKTVSKAWFDATGPVSLEERRMKILTSLAHLLAQLSQFKFDKIGSLHTNEDDIVPSIGPCYDWEENDDGSLAVVASGPFEDSRSYLQQHYDEDDTKKSEDPWGVAEAKLMEVMMPHLPIHDPSEGFVLSIPDLDSQNVIVDEDGTVTGIIDLDHIQTVPRCVGYCRYPSWITRDWDPLMYGWPKLTDSENSPEELERYRKHYNREMGAALGGKGDWKYTQKSQIWEAVWIAALNRRHRLEICRKLVQVTQGDEVDALDILYDVGTDNLSEDDWGNLKKALGCLMSP
ncbi:hypothetical protein QBC46DRAFT_58533 [Diplogelasinospora grovesii]|uniref:Aminoglycoside phosphotransferase domain-containing protein n=1 Tax=Diplogelasinospora grovesii TaxID=303347 RepID=A0AAN6S0B4_9PEZI|nr:hypothetical protein QBC46DRAFT_58533 [Diplogelasinospora grovesii]